MLEKIEKLFCFNLNRFYEIRSRSLEQVKQGSQSSRNKSLSSPHSLNSTTTAATTTADVAATSPQCSFQSQPTPTSTTTSAKRPNLYLKRNESAATDRTITTNNIDVVRSSSFKQSSINNNDSDNVSAAGQLGPILLMFIYFLYFKEILGLESTFKIINLNVKMMRLRRLHDQKYEMFIH